ncbi:CLUMA_CG021449, isoform A [Clunio marinus]|uniref:CLUMA_CG021449, isoform A n=1 Tax=Clunio marinus TaxID=568069 RepID=A0A1J1J7N7_9DIPT|nr:CLUMA_CG021449, isoform A [Clunio marinus]
MPNKKTSHKMPPESIFCDKLLINIHHVKIKDSIKCLNVLRLFTLERESTCRRTSRLMGKKLLSLLAFQSSNEILRRERRK